MGCFGKPFFRQNDPHIGGSFWQMNSLLQQTMTLLQGPKDPILPSLARDFLSLWLSLGTFARNWPKTWQVSGKALAALSWRDPQYLEYPVKSVAKGEVA